jgi:hypothetical protein
VTAVAGSGEESPGVEAGEEGQHTVLAFQTLHPHLCSLSSLFKCGFSVGALPEITKELFSTLHVTAPDRWSLASILRIQHLMS